MNKPKELPPKKKSKKKQNVSESTPSIDHLIHEPYTHEEPYKE